MEFNSNLDDTENRFLMLLKSIPLPALFWKKMNNSLTLVNSNDESYRTSGGKIKEYFGRNASEIYKNDSQILKGMQNCVLNDHKFSITANNGIPIVDNGISYKLSFELIAPDTIVQYFIENSSVNMELHQTRELNLMESEEKYRILSENSDDLITLYDEKFRIIYINAESHSRVLGYPAKKFLKHSFKNIIAHKDDVIPLINIIKKGIKEGNYRGQIRFKHQEGHYLWFQITAKFFSVASEKKKLLVIARDITDIKQYEENLRESEEKYRFLTENSDDLITLYNDKMVAEYSNTETHSRVLGYTPEKFLKASFKGKITHKDDVKPYVASYREGVKKGRFQHQARFKHKEGHYLWFQTYGKFFNDITDQRKLLVVARNITDIKQAEKNLRESEEKYRVLTEYSEDFITLYNNKMVKEYINAETHSRVLGYPPEKFSKLSFQSTILHTDDVQPYLSRYREGLESGSYSVQIRFKHKEGHYLWFQIYGKFFNDINNQRKLLVVGRNITDIKQVEENLRESEEKYRGFVNNISDIIYEIDVKGKCSYVSHQLLDISGFAPEEMIGKNVFKFVHPEDLALVAEEVRRVFNTEDNPYIEFRLRHKDGHYVPIASRFSAIKIGGEQKLTGVLVDISERKKVEQKLKESEEQFRIIAEQAYMGVMIIQNDLIKYGNSALLDIIEYSPKDAEGWTLEDAINLAHPEDLEPLIAYRTSLREGISSKSKYHSYRVYTKSGKLKWIDQFSKSIIFNGEPAELLTIIDITEKKDAEEELIKLNNLKSELFVRSSHELKTPLVSIKGFADLLLTVHRSKLDDYSISKLTAIKNGADRLQKLIADILKAAELESGTTKINIKNGNISDLIRICVREVQGFADLRKHSIKLDVKPNLFTNFEQEGIHKVISNLLHNAIKYTPPYGNIEIKSEIRDNYIVTSVKDDGIGFTSEEKKMIFKQFGKIERYGQNLQVIPDGTGLGLFISKKIVELHGGEIWTESESRNQGSTFYFSLPLIQSSS